MITDIMGHASIASTKARWFELVRKLKGQVVTTPGGGDTPGPKRKTGGDQDTPSKPPTKRARKPKAEKQGDTNVKDDDANVKEETEET